MVDFASYAKAISNQYGGPFHTGLVVYYTEPIYDAGGSITTPGGRLTQDCVVQMDRASYAMRQEEGFSDGDVRLIVTDLVGDITTDSRIEISTGPYAGTWLVMTVERDAMASHWECRGRKA